jgi:multidrug transporter EmrE-like cation transporter
MLNYALGVFLGILTGMINFFGGVLQKKAINDTPMEMRDQNLMKALVKNKIWILGLLCQMAFSTVFLMLAQSLIGATLMPGLMASGLIILAIGSVKLLKEQLKINEIIAIIFLIIGITLIGLSELTIQTTIANFLDIGFNLRIGIVTIFFAVAWLSLYYTGKKAKKNKSLLLAIGTGFPPSIANIWMQPMIVAMVIVLNGTAGSIEWFLFLLSVFITTTAIFSSITHTQTALNSGNVSIIAPVQQIPQQISPLFIYYFIYMLASPNPLSFPLILTGVLLIVTSGFVLAKRQAALEKIK